MLFRSLSILTTVFGTASRDEAKEQIPSFMAEATPDQKAVFEKTGELPPPWGQKVLAEGMSMGFVAATVMVLLAVVVAVVAIKVRKTDLEALSGAAGPGVA